MMMLQHIKESVTEDLQAILYAKELSIHDTRIDHGNGLKFMHEIFTKLCRDRAYDDNHPNFVNGSWKRILPFDGREYLFFYHDSKGNRTLNDNHLETLLLNIKKDLQ